MDLFELMPFVREHFYAIIEKSGKYDPEDSEVMQSILENHAKLIMNVVHEVVANIDDLHTVGDKLVKIGLFHCKNGVPKKFLDIMGPLFCNAVRPILLKNNIWSSAMEEAWMEVFLVITSIMKRSYDGVENLPQELWLQPTEKCVIVATWHSIFLKHMAHMGKSLFVDMFNVEPNILRYFDTFKDSARGINNVALNQKFQAHGTRVMNLIKFVVENIENRDKLKDHLYILGCLHVKKKIDPKFLELMGPTFCQAIR